MNLPKIELELDAWFRAAPTLMPRFIRDVYFHALRDGLSLSQARFYFDSNGLPYLSTICPSDGSWGQEYTVQEVIDLVHERLQEDAKLDETSLSPPL